MGDISWLVFGIPIAGVLIFTLIFCGVRWAYWRAYVVKDKKTIYCAECEHRYAIFCEKHKLPLVNVEGVYSKHGKCKY